MINTEQHTPAPSAAPDESFQARVQPWMLACFGPAIAADGAERNHRFLEESLELVQACGCTASEAHQLVNYVFGRPVGERAQEVGGVMITLAALCLAQNLDMHAAGETELARIWTKVEAIRAKQAAKPKQSPLPVARTQPVATHAAMDILMERFRQVQLEGVTNDADDSYHHAELPRAAAAYLLNGAEEEAPAIWPWASAWWKPRDIRSNYVRAGALVLAEIERIDRNTCACPSGDGTLPWPCPQHPPVATAEKA